MHLTGKGMGSGSRGGGGGSCNGGLELGLRLHPEAVLVLAEAVHVIG